jgi:hypothetical protein
MYKINTIAADNRLSILNIINHDFMTVSFAFPWASMPPPLRLYSMDSRGLAATIIFDVMRHNR